MMMKKFIGILVVALFLCSCNPNTVRYDVVEGKGHIYYCSKWGYTIDLVHEQFPDATLIVYHAGWIVYTSE
jgi:hypothetical protein